MSRWTCPRCSLSMPVEASDYPIHCACGVVDDGKTPSWWARANQFTRAAISHVTSGAPTCTQEEIDARLRVCEGCVFFTGNRCRKCGCNVSESKFLNKLAWADQSCPVDKWGAVDVLIPLPHREGPSKSLLGDLAVAELRAMGLRGRVAFVGERSAETLRLHLRASQTRLVVNHAMYFPPAVVGELAAEFPRTRFVTVNHSSQSHLLHAPAWITDQRDHWALARDRQNVWFGLVDERLPVERHARVVHVPNLVPSLVATKRDQAATKPRPSVLLCGRMDWAKNLPNQLAALRGLDVHAQLCVRGLREADAAALAETYGLRSWEILPWVTSWPRHVARLGQSDVGLQASFTESWNCAALEMLAAGRPVVGSPALRYLPGDWQANPDAPEAIRDVLTRILGDYGPSCQRAVAVADGVRRRQSDAFRGFVGRVLT